MDILLQQKCISSWFLVLSTGRKNATRLSPYLDWLPITITMVVSALDRHASWLEWGGKVQVENNAVDDDYVVLLYAL